MLRIGKLTDYAVLIVSQLAKQTDAVMSASLLAEVLHIAKPTVSKILKILSDADIVCSVRGAEGGYYLATPASEISIADVVQAMEGELAMTECCTNKSQCKIESMCTMRSHWQSINGVIHSLLSKMSITDL